MTAKSILKSFAISVFECKPGRIEGSRIFQVDLGILKFATSAVSYIKPFVYVIFSFRLLIISAGVWSRAALFCEYLITEDAAITCSSEFVFPHWVLFHHRNCTLNQNRVLDLAFCVIYQLRLFINFVAVIKLRWTRVSPMLDLFHGCIYLPTYPGHSTNQCQCHNP